MSQNSVLMKFGCLVETREFFNDNQKLLCKISQGFWDMGAYVHVHVHVYAERRIKCVAMFLGTGNINNK